MKLILARQSLSRRKVSVSADGSKGVKLLAVIAQAVNDAMFQYPQMDRRV